jgi:hypothetical protein
MNDACLSTAQSTISDVDYKTNTKVTPGPVKISKITDDDAISTHRHHIFIDGYTKELQHRQMGRQVQRGRSGNRTPYILRVPVRAPQSYAATYFVDYHADFNSNQADKRAARLTEIKFD